MNMIKSLAAGLCLSALATAASAQVSEDVIRSLSAPDSVETRIGTLKFDKGAPTSETAQAAFDAVAFSNALSVYNNSFRGASALALVKGFQSVGATSNSDVVIFSEALPATNTDWEESK